ncbi:Gfo/Idh/MocA family oxidoreductase [Novosphingobium sp.]|uniref:Gfo/Idh/MocA family protein n=1 Tax=Novosphingobium sp. TaxID=1874826 RepID=UPI0025FE7238|nr:Gfo/Idh/MocA family oxidoreductase [Novosphingobium sp.]
MAAKQDIGVALVGYGKIARDKHEGAIAVTPGLRLAAVVDPAVQHATLPSYPTMAQMLAAQPDIGAVALCQPPRYRAQSVVEALQAGLHVFCEKPPGIDPAEVDRWGDLSATTGLTLFTAWHSREGAAVHTARSWLAQTTARKILITWKEDVRRWHPGQAWIWAEDGFGVFDPGINALSILTALVPGRIRMREAKLERPENCATPIAALLAMESDSGIAISADFDFRQTGPQSWDIAIEADAGRLLLSNGGNTLSIDGADQDCGAEQEYPRLYVRFVELIGQGACEVDASPLQLVCDATSIAQVQVVEPFYD